MFASRILRLPSVFWTTLWIALLILVLGVTRVHSQGLPQKTASPPKYDTTATETRIKGTVEEIKSAAPESKTALIELMLKGESATVQVPLCPKQFLDDLGVGYAKGDTLEITG